MKVQPQAQAERAYPVLPCTCANLRRAARAVTRMYDRELRPIGLEPTQYSLLMALDLKGETTQGKLGALLALDSTTLTRMLGLLIKKGWIAERSGDDRRQRLLQLTLSGRRKLKESHRHWERAQEHLKESMGESAWNQLSEMLAQVTRIAVGT